MDNALLLPVDDVQWGLDFPGKSLDVGYSSPQERGESMSRKNKRVLVVFRVSNEQLTTKNQEMAMAEHIKSLPVAPTVLHITGSNWRHHIPQMNVLEREIREGLWDEVHFWRVCRTGRNHTRDCQLWDLCVESGVVLRYIDDGLRSDDDQCRLYFHMKSAIADYERRLLSRRTKEGMKRWREEAIAKGEPDPLIGRRRNQIHHKTRRLIPVVYDLLRAGQKVHGIAKALGRNRHSLMKIKRLSLEEARRLSGKKNLQDWR